MSSFWLPIKTSVCRVLLYQPLGCKRSPDTPLTTAGPVRCSGPGPSQRNLVQTRTLLKRRNGSGKWVGSAPPFLGVRVGGLGELIGGRVHKAGQLVSVDPRSTPAGTPPGESADRQSAAEARVRSRVETLKPTLPGVKTCG